MSEEHQEPEAEDMEQKHYREERAMLIQGESEAAMSLDRTMITLSAGALFLSITFVHDISPHPTHTPLLFSAWAMFMLSLLSIVISLIASQYAFKAAQTSQTGRCCRCRQILPAPASAPWPLGGGGFFASRGHPLDETRPERAQPVQYRRRDKHQREEIQPR